MWINFPTPLFAFAAVCLSAAARTAARPGCLRRLPAGPWRFAPCPGPAGPGPAPRLRRPGQAGRASPYYLDNEALKYIDYDLDVKVFADGEKRLLDIEEYERHKKQMHYSDDLDFILKENVKILVDWINNGRGPFSDAYVNIWYKRYVELKNR